MSFEIPEMLKQAWDARSAGQSHQAAWQAHWQVYAQTYPDLAQAFEQRMDGTVPAHLSTDMAACLQAFHAEAATVASRKASQLALTQLVQLLPQLLGGSADLTGSNLTQVPGMLPLRMDAQGRVAACPSPAPQISPSDTSFHINYGVREFGMAAIMNGIALHGGFIPYGGTFLTFSDYSRNAIRMAALMKLRVIHVLTHDSVGLGEDGPTHQPIEQAASLRLIPGLSVWRPADTSETWVAWACALQCTPGPTALLLSRQNLPYLPQNEATLAAIARGGYVLQDAPDAKAVLIASGSEVHLSLQAQALLAAQGIAVRLVSMPSTTVFDQQEVLYRQTVLPSHLPKIAIEMASPGLWWKYGCEAVVGLETYGASAPASVLLPHFGFTPERIAEVVQQVLCAP
jgi:transketolase